VRTDNEFRIRLLAHQVRREQITAHLRLTVPRRHRDHQTLAFARDHTVQGRSDTAMVLTDNHLGPHVATEIQEGGRCTFLRFKLQESKF